MRRRILASLSFVALLCAGPGAHAQQSGSFQAATPALAASLNVATGANRVLRSFDVAADTTLSGAAWWIMVFDATTIPANGTVAPNKCYAELSGVAQANLSNMDTRFQTGIVIGVSTTGCFTLTGSPHAFISADYQ
jgi:hypothetical protein